MNKTSYIISILALCFFVSFMILSIKTFATNGDNGLASTNDVSNISDTDFGSEPDPDDVEIGSTFTGPSGTTYELEEENLSAEEEEYNTNFGISGDGVWVEVNGTTPTTKEKENWGWNCNKYTGECTKKRGGQYGTLAYCEKVCKITLYQCKVCGTGGCSAGKCVNKTFSSPCTNECETDAQCNGGTPPPEEEPPAVEPPPVSPPPVSPPPVSPPPVSPPPVSPPPVSPPAPKCGIIEFSINGKTNDDRDPLLVWVDASLKGRISTDADCTKCTVESDDTWGNPNPVEYAMTLTNNYNIVESFQIPETGTYSFTVECIGDPTDPDDIVVDNFSLETIQAINLPWWREIIPVLPGFLRGVWR